MSKHQSRIIDHLRVVKAPPAERKPAKVAAKDAAVRARTREKAPPAKAEDPAVTAALLRFKLRDGANLGFLPAFELPFSRDAVRELVAARADASQPPLPDYAESARCCDSTGSTKEIPATAAGFDEPTRCACVASAAFQKTPYDGIRCDHNCLNRCARVRVSTGAVQCWLSAGL